MSYEPEHLQKLAKQRAKRKAEQRLIAEHYSQWLEMYREEGEQETPPVRPRGAAQLRAEIAVLESELHKLEQSEVRR